MDSKHNNVRSIQIAVTPKARVAVGSQLRAACSTPSSESCAISREGLYETTWESPLRQPARWACLSADAGVVWRCASGAPDAALGARQPRRFKVVLESRERGRFSQSRMMAAARAGLQPALTARACTRTPSSRACRCAQSIRSWCCNSAALRPHRFPASPPSVVPLPPAPPPADAVVRALFGSRPRGGGSSVGPGRAARLEDGTPNRVPILSFCSFLPVSRLCRETAECVPS